MPSRDLKLHLLLICLPAVVLTGIGIVFLTRQSAAAAVREAEIRAIRAEQLAQAVRDRVLDEAPVATERETLLADLETGDGHRRPDGTFAWQVRTGLIRSHGLPTSVASNLAARAFLKDWTDGTPAAAKKPPLRGELVLPASPEPCHVFWARAGARDDRIFGTVFMGDPVASGFGTATIWPVALVLVVLLAGVLAAGAGLMARAAAKARRDDKTKTSFVSNVSHELKTPLAGIGLWIDLLRKGRIGTEDRRQHAYEVIAEENARMMRLVENLLDFSRIESGRTVLHMASVDAGALAVEVADVVRGSFAAHGLEVRTDGTCVARADGDAVRQILLNLLGNAVKYAAADGPVELMVSAANGMVRVAVADRGPGLSAEEQARVFDRFYRADDALDSKTGGLGLGLSISRALARGMGGDLVVATRPGGGCVFTLELPPIEQSNNQSAASCAIISRCERKGK